MTESPVPASPPNAVAGVGDIVRDVIADVAPEELPVVDGLRRMDPGVASRKLRRRRWRRRDPVGFGTDVVVALMTPVAWIVIEEFVKQGIVEGAVGTLTERVRSLVRTAVRRLLRRPAPAVTAPQFTRDQLAAVGQRVKELAPAYRLESGQAEALAERVVARLALGVTAAGGPDDADPGTARARTGD